MRQQYFNFRSSLLLTTLLGVSQAWGVPANPRLQPVSQPDGTQILARLHGDEHTHFTLSEENLPIDRAADGFFHYYTCDSEGRPILSSQRVSNPDGRSEEEWKMIASIDRNKLQQGFEISRKDDIMRRSRRNLPPQAAGFPCTGSPRGLVLLIEYSDVYFTTPDPNDAFNRMLNEPGYSDHGAWGSARDWFIDNSGGRFTPQFDVVGPIRLEHPRAYYGANKGSNDVRPEMMIIEACGLIANEIDFSLYDEDDDGYIDNIFAFYAGYGENLGIGAPSECVWPHSWDIVEATSVPYYFNGKRLNHYACTNEIDLNDLMDGIGTFVHEFSHVMGLPDLYATNYSFAFTPGEWSVMDGGPYNNNSRTPPCYSAFERLSLGWLDPILIDRPANIKIPAIAENRAYYIPTELENEYFILENRQQTGWDTFIPYHGMLVWHIDYNPNIWRYNTVNDRQDHQYVDIIEADAHPHSDTIESDPFPGKSNITSITDETSPALRSWAGVGCGVPLTDIYESNGYVYFKAMGGKTSVEPVKALEATEIGITSFTANWEAAEEDVEYLLSVYYPTILSNGQTSVTYAEGYENLNLGKGVTSHKVENLEPGKEYRFTIRLHDIETNLESVASNEVTVALLPPTFDYLTPLATEATEITTDSFRANWNPLEGADKYLLTVVEKKIGEPESMLCGFDEGLTDLPSGWSTNSRLTYAAEDYCGLSAPSLRMNSEGHYLEIAAPEGFCRGLELWVRGVGLPDEANLELRAFTGKDWENVTSFMLDNSSEGITLTAEESAIPYGVSLLRVIFHPAGKGSIAVDDVTLYYGGRTEILPIASFTDKDAGKECSMKVTGLEPSRSYYYSIKAISGGMTSRVSNEIRVVTSNDSDAVATFYDESLRIKQFSDGSILILNMHDSDLATLCDASGRIILRAKGDGSGKLILRAPESGIFILRVGGKSCKLIR